MLTAIDTKVHQHLAKKPSEAEVGGERRERAPIMIKNENTSVIEDAYLVAALITIDSSVVYYPVLKETGRVVFEVKGNISSKLERFYQGEEARLDLFVANHKKLRAAIFKLKNAYKKTRGVPAENHGES